MGILKQIFEPIYIFGLFLLAIVGSLFSLTFMIIVVALVSIIFIPLLILNFIFYKINGLGDKDVENNTSNHNTTDNANS